jgi:hypothetical protein
VLLIEHVGIAGVVVAERSYRAELLGPIAGSAEREEVLACCYVEYAYLLCEQVGQPEPAIRVQQDRADPAEQLGPFLLGAQLEHCRRHERGPPRRGIRDVLVHDDLDARTVRPGHATRRSGGFTPGKGDEERDRDRAPAHDHDGVIGSSRHDPSLRGPDHGPPCRFPDRCVVRPPCAPPGRAPDVPRCQRPWPVPGAR